MALALMGSLHYISCQGTGNLKYLDRDPPGVVPKLFAPGVVSKLDGYEFGSAFSKKGDEFYYAVRLDDNWKAEIRSVVLKDGVWTTPTKLPLESAYGYNDPFLSKDGNRLYFMSNRPKKENNNTKTTDLWYIERKGTHWSAPISLGAPINSEKNEYYVSMEDKGTLYFASNAHTTNKNEWDHDIYYAEQENGKFKNLVRMGNEINNENFDVDPYIAPDGSYLIFCSSDREDGFGQGDLYISFRKGNNRWTKAKNMGPIINTKGHEFCPFVTRDGKYLFYTGEGDIYWVSAGIIDDYR